MVGKASADHDPPSSAGIFAGFGKPHDSKAGPTRMPALPGLLQGLEAGGAVGGSGWRRKAKERGIYAASVCGVRGPLERVDALG